MIRSRLNIGIEIPVRIVTVPALELRSGFIVQGKF